MRKVGREAAAGVHSLGAACPGARCPPHRPHNPSSPTLLACQGKFTKASSVQLRNLMRTADDEGVRRACYEGLRSIGPCVAAKFADIVKLRNKLARVAGYRDYYGGVLGK